MQNKTEILIVGGGVTGCFIARELSKYKLDITLVEKEPDVCTGTTKANTALLHAGFNADANKLKGRLNVRGNQLYHQRVQHNLDVPIKWLGALVVAKDEADLPKLEAILENAKKNGVDDLEIVKEDRLFELEPNLNPEAIAALYAPTAGIVNPFQLTIALANNAVDNGVNLSLETEVLAIEDYGEYKKVITNQGSINTKIIVNAAGLFADKIANMVGIDKFEITPRRGEYYLYDRKIDIDVERTIFPVPTEVSKGIVVTPTDEGHLLIGPNAEEITDKKNKSTTRKGLARVLAGAQKVIPNLDKSGIIKEFAGLRAVVKETEDFLIEASDKVDGFVNVAGIQSPGLASAPAIAELVIDIIGEKLINLEKNPEFNPTYEALPKFRELSYEKRASLIEKNPDYGQIICRCETVSKGEIIDAINQPVGAKTVNAIKRRVRPGSGRCQGGFCEPKVVNILAEELGIGADEVLLEGEGSQLLVERSKKILLREGGRE